MIAENHHRQRGARGLCASMLAVFLFLSLFPAMPLFPVMESAEAAKPYQWDRRDLGKPPQGPGPGSFTIEQSLSDRAQETTMAFAGLAFLTGNACMDTLFPPGKMADFFGFQYLRDNDPNGLGHNTDFTGRSAAVVLGILGDEQIDQLKTLAAEQAGPINDYALGRIALVQAFRRALEGDVPEGSDGLDEQAVGDYSAGLYRLDAEISIRRAEVMGAILSSLTGEQLAYLKEMAVTGMAGWPEERPRMDRRGLSHDEDVALTTYAGQMLSWYGGSVDGDVYFCPERHGTYFGAFYLKGAPARGQRDYNIDENRTGSSGEAFLAMLDSSQRRIMSDLLDRSRGLLDRAVEVRRSIAEELRAPLAGQAIDRERVLGLAEGYGRLDGELNYGYAVAFAALARSMTSRQRQELASIRGLEGDICDGAYLYSNPIPMPEVRNGNYFFGIGPEPEVEHVEAQDTMPGPGQETGQRLGQGNPPPPPPVDSANFIPAAVSCLENSADEPECKDCCDCLEASANERKICRDACRSGEFVAPSRTDRFMAPSILGPGGEYSICTGQADERECKHCCDDSQEYLCGDRRYCRDACMGR